MAVQLHYLITGGAGFIGCHIVNELMKKDQKVTVIDNLFTGKIENIKHWIENPNFKFIKGDVIDPKTFEGLQVDRIFHLACPASPPHYMYDPIHTIETCYHGVTNVMKLAMKCGARVVNASTSEVYGDPDIHPQVEEYWGNVNIRGPRSCYDEGKRIGETIAYNYNKQHGVKSRTVRLFNTYGPNMDPNDGRVVSNFIMQALQNKDLTIYGDGTFTRSFGYVADIVAGLLALIDWDDNWDYNGAINIGNPTEFSIKELAEKVLKQIPESTSKIAYLESVVDDPRKRKPDITKATKYLGWVPKIQIDEGLVPTIAYFRTLIPK